jgi:hypothetical protein
MSPLRIDTSQSVLISLINFISSAYSSFIELKSSDIWLIKIINRIGPCTNPWAHH